MFRLTSSRRTCSRRNRCDAGCLLVIAATETAYAQDFSLAGKSPGTNWIQGDYGAAGGHALNATIDQASGELTGQVFDPQNNLRREVKETYSTDDGGKHEAEKLVYDFGLKGNLLTLSDYKFDLKGGLSYLDNEHFGLHGERMWEQKITYRPDGYDTSTWHVGLDYQHEWTKETTTYKPPPDHAQASLQSPTTQPLQPPPPSSTMQLGVLFPRDFHCRRDCYRVAMASHTLMPRASKRFPASANTPLTRRGSAFCRTALHRGRALRSASRMMATSAVESQRHIFLHIPSTWTGPSPVADARSGCSLPGTPTRRARCSISAAVAIPALPSNLISPKVTGAIKAENLKYLTHLWNWPTISKMISTALEEIKDDETYWAMMEDAKSYEYYLWEEIDAVIETLPPANVAQQPTTRIANADEQIKTLENGAANTRRFGRSQGSGEAGRTSSTTARPGSAHWLAEAIASGVVREPPYGPNLW